VGFGHQRITVTSRCCNKLFYSCLMKNVSQHDREKKVCLSLVEVGWAVPCRADTAQPSHALCRFGLCYVGMEDMSDHADMAR
jgi:hypothetical protein